ncbi:MAG: bacteriocin immunity protein [Sporolactobacillus sp.]
MKDKRKEIFEQMNKAYADEAVKDNADLSKVLLDYAQALEEGRDYKLLCVKLSSALNAYLLTHHFKAPQSIIDLYYKVANDAAQYRGWASMTKFLR